MKENNVLKVSYPRRRPQIPSSVPQTTYVINFSCILLVRVYAYANIFLPFFFPSLPPLPLSLFKDHSRQPGDVGLATINHQLLTVAYSSGEIVMILCFWNKLEFRSEVLLNIYSFDVIVYTSCDTSGHKISLVNYTEHFP